MKQKTNNLIFVLYDGIKNSVFYSQVLAPLQKKIKKENIQQATIISFEKDPLAIKNYTKNIHLNIRINIIIIKKHPFLGRFSLMPAIHRLKKILKKHMSYNIIARGPIAGYLCSQAIDFNLCNSYTIQARGLIAQEYKYTHKNEKNILLQCIHAIRYYQYKSLEKTLYKNSFHLPNTHIEAVSEALKTYIVTHFHVKKHNVTIATNDIPQTVDRKQASLWYTEIRKALHITPDKTVYCYNGSVKSWQCPEKVAHFFKKQHTKHKHSFLLVLTQDTKQFANVIQTYDIPKSSYLLKTIKPDDIYKYLCACDYGIIFREINIINWVSRPTKILEYQAVRLPIIHNNTIEMLQDTSQKSI